MIRKSGEHRVFARGPGVEIKVLAEPGEIYDAGRLYARITFEPGSSIDYHVHKAEMESYHMIKGTLRVDDNGETTYLTEGDTMITPQGQGHAVHNEGSESAEMIALIVSTKQGVPGSSG